MKKLMVTWLLMVSVVTAYSQISIDLEGNYAFSIPYNVVRIPASGGTEIDLAKDLNATNPLTFRARINYTLNERHVISALVAPLRVKSQGTLSQDVVYSDNTFQAGRKINATYTFNSYRLTYRYLFIANDKIKFGAGLTAKLRQANIELTNGERSADYPDLGVVPLVNVYFSWTPVQRWTMLIEGDALGTNQGRAEDVFGGILYNASETTSIKIGYRVLEGGADVEDNYNFSFFNYAAIGVVLNFK
ncbi:hypothetical protein [Pseudochryseolinea flava]|uniref:Outer membrane protein beta-barrel domain-containing protein n=1 Tax=Pseudochryseolinea flava TaxID=2059302 RepID=A0A364Y1E2_9BACT|nr:hypothetical protein [Pseudochryseolinea flava]RAW00653.1 hypothetical protein DQQ10_13775 [Pseudochryseolinea flava]